MRDEQLHAVVVRRAFRSQHVQNTSCLDHFWRLRCRKSARRCGAKHISRLKVLKCKKLRGPEHDNGYVLFLRRKQAPPTPEFRIPLSLVEYVKKEDKKQ